MLNPTQRWRVVLGALLIQICLGAIYAWSAFTPELQVAGWTKLQTQVVFSVGLAMFAFSMVISGRLMSTWGPRRLSVIGGLTLGAGYALAGLMGGTSFLWTLVGVGIIGGIGIGTAYVVPIAVGIRWFPDKKGVISGVAVAGFGFGAMGWIKVAGEWGGLLAGLGLGTTWIIYGAVFTALVLTGAIWMIMPPSGWTPEGYVVPDAPGAGGEDFSPKEMLRTPQFHLISLTFMVSAGAGLMAIGLMKLFPVEALMSNGLSAAEASAAAGTAMAVFFSLANGIGRIAWGTISDRLGRKKSVVLLAGSQGILLFLFTTGAGQIWSLFLLTTLVGFNFGGNFALFPALTADEFGIRSVGRNYPWIFLAYGFGGIVFPILGGWLGDMGNFPMAFTLTGVLCFVGAVAAWLVFPPHLDEAKQPFTVTGFLHNAHLFDR